MSNATLTAILDDFTAKMKTAIAALPDATPVPGPTPTPTTDPLGSPISGVTVDDIQGVADTVAALSALGRRPCTRVVFDEGMAASYYASAVKAIHSVSSVMGELLDSSAMKAISVAAFKARVTEYVTALGADVDLWEVGNEINGEWLGAKADVVAKMVEAYTQIKAAGKKSALTLYYNAGCGAPAENEMFAWAAANVPANMKTGLDYVLVSYYEDDCSGKQPAWPQVFEQLGTLFPNSKLGIGECGSSIAAEKATMMTRYYAMGSTMKHPRFVGGYFWWYFHQDCVPKTKALFATLKAAVAAMPAPP